MVPDYPGIESVQRGSRNTVVMYRGLISAPWALQNFFYGAMKYNVEVR